MCSPSLCPRSNQKAPFVASAGTGALSPSHTEDRAPYRQPASPVLSYTCKLQKQAWFDSQPALFKSSSDDCLSHCSAVWWVLLSEGSFWARRRAEGTRLSWSVGLQAWRQDLGIQRGFPASGCPVGTCCVSLNTSCSLSVSIITSISYSLSKLRWPDFIRKERKVPSASAEDWFQGCLQMLTYYTQLCSPHLLPYI